MYTLQQVIRSLACKLAQQVSKVTYNIKFGYISSNLLPDQVRADGPLSVSKQAFKSLTNQTFDLLKDMNDKVLPDKERKLLDEL